MISITLSDIEIELVKELEILSKMSINERNKWLRENEDCSKNDDIITHQYIGLMQALVTVISIALKIKGIDMKDENVNGGFLK